MIKNFVLYSLIFFSPEINEDKRETNKQLNIAVGIRSKIPILSKERLMLISDLNHIELNYKIIKKIIPNCKIISLYTKTKTKKYVDISLYNFKSNEELIFPWELK